MGICPLISPTARVISPTARAVFMDRDGVVNVAMVRDGKPFPPQTFEEFALAPGIRTAIERLRNAGFLIIVVTNQPDVARGTQSKEVVERMHNWLHSELALDEVLVCWHDEKDACECRKPKPGLVFVAAARYGINLSRSYMIGDRWRDVDAGHAAGCVSLLIDYRYRERGPAEEPAARVTSVEKAADWILANDKEYRQ